MKEKKMIDPLLAEKSSDEELIALTLKDQDYFGEIIKRYQVKLFNYIIRISGLAAEDAEDVLQDIFLKIYLNLNDFDSGQKFSSWAYAIAHNQVISQFRKRQARPEGHAVNLEDNAAKNLMIDFDLLKDLDLRRAKELINKVLEKLEPKYREILVLKFLTEQSYQEISDIIKKPLGTVASLMNKAKEEFRREVKSQKINF
ncbi:MAG: RNA polymerase sigma factor [Patescibacteria group bacterium]